MQLSIPLSYKKNSFAQSLRFLFPVTLFAIGFIFLRGYIAGTVTLVTIGLAAVWSTMVKQQIARPRHWAFATLLLIAITAFIPVNTCLYLSIGMALFFWVELQYASVGFLGFAALLLSSPAFHYSEAVFSFPLRLQLTSLVGIIFSVTSESTQIKENSIFYSGHEFSVDPACAGLNMLSISLLMGIFLIGLLQRKFDRSVTWKPALVYLLCLFVFNLVANLFRIILLVQFAIPADTIMHDVAGLMCLLLYVGLPACYLAKYLVSKSLIRQVAVKRERQKKRLIIQALLVIGLMIMSVRVSSTDTYAKFNDKNIIAITGYTSSVFAPGIIKLEGHDAFVYVKFIRGFYDTEHNPTLCWKGSGYEFKEVRSQHWNGNEIYTATLTKNKEKLYTAWWYGNGINNTVSQWEWRFNMLKGKKGYALINVTAASEAALVKEVKKIVLANVLLPLF